MSGEPNALDGGDNDTPSAALLRNVTPSADEDLYAPQGGQRAGYDH